MGAATEQWHVVDELFQAALDMSAEERAAFIQKLAEGDRTVHDEVLSLLDAMDTDSVLDEDAGALSGPLWTEFARSIVDDELDGKALKRGSRVGPYTITGELGRGGMAVVYEASRDFGPMKQRFALKVIKRGADTDEVVSRFSVERQILASLNHPNIARLHDGGVSEDGRPYFVMEYVDGTPIVDYARENELTVSERLRLFVDVCAAVQYAHRNLVVHRDLKPSNILVTHDAQPKLLDFGIAKVMAADSDQIKTQTGSFWLTPDYASPEQVRGLTVTTSSDVYGLGVVLYELLTGRRPFVFSRRDPIELRRMICETHPEKPSVAVHRDLPGDRGHKRLVRFMDRRPWSPERVARELKGDLDTIVMKALRKEPERRYESAEALVADIRRHLSGRPVKARPDSAGYRVKKFARRNVRPLSLSAAALILSIGFTFYHTASVTRQRNIAQQQAEKSNQVASFMSGLLGELRPNESAGGTIRVEDILAHGVDKVNRDLVRQPDVQAQVYDLIGNIYEEYGHYDEAVRVLRQAVELNKATFGADSPESSRTLALLGWTLHKRGETALGERYLLQALAIQQRTPGMEGEVTTTRTSLGWIYYDGDQLQRAEDTFREVLEARRRLTGEQDLGVAAAYGNLGYILRTQKRFAEAEPYYRSALRIVRGLYSEHTELAGALHGLGTLLVANGELEEAQPFIVDGLAMRRRLFGAEHPQVAESLSNLGSLYQDLGRYAEAEASLQEALAMRQRLFSAEHRTVANSLNLLGWLYYRWKQYEKAEPLMVEAIRQYRKVAGQRHSSVAAALNKLGLIQIELDQFPKAQRSFEQAINIREELGGPNLVDIEVVRTNLAMAFVEQDSLGRAEAILEEVLRQRVASLPVGHYRIGQASRDLGMVKMRQGEFVEAEELLQDGFDVLRTANGIDDDYSQTALEYLRDFYARTGDGRKSQSYGDLVTRN